MFTRLFSPLALIAVLIWLVACIPTLAAFLASL
jgi:hypothetical protein